MLKFRIIQDIEIQIEFYQMDSEINQEIVANLILNYSSYIISEVKPF
jgi:hypothetical protein